MGNNFITEEYKKVRHFIDSKHTVTAKCGKMFLVLRTMQGFGGGNSGFYISPCIPMNDITDQTAIRKTQEEVIQYIETEGWNDYATMIKNRNAKQNQ